MIHNASIEKYRTPVGAVTCGSEMTIRLYETGESVSKAEIIMYSETFHREYEMKRKKDCMEEHLKITNEASIVCSTSTSTTDFWKEAARSARLISSPFIWALLI